MNVQIVPAEMVSITVLVGLTIFGMVWSSWREAQSWRAIDRAARIRECRSNSF
jgi:hypothetical protein